ncbi:unnamed protein product [Dimorphilus gyrociliatus]|uniref:Uncharacterized protein n=1 Tax=Dimorphilus gyrociliatus TaxID=2664684 RepID=A0A7I8VZC8_9ANNE|nr:unnamed protein product [Dimorphilus gyrociliatus]
MNKEKKERLTNVIRRLITFRSCKVGSMSYCSLAKKGFYFNSEINVIECHECGKLYSAWKDDVNHYAFCSYGTEPFPRLVKTTRYDADSFRHFPSPQPVLAVPKNMSESDSESEENDNLNSDQENERRQTEKESESYQEALFKYQEAMRKLDNDIPLRTLLRNDLTIQMNRYKTFSTTCAPWPWRGVIPGRELARCGFFFCGDTDRVQCFSCGITLRKWSYGDMPFEVHLKNSPSCRHVKKLVDDRNPFI